MRAPATRRATASANAGRSECGVLEAERWDHGQRDGEQLLLAADLALELGAAVAGADMATEHRPPEVATGGVRYLLSDLSARDCPRLAVRPSDVRVEEMESSSFGGLTEEVERRADLKQIVADFNELPERQRAALAYG